MRLLAAAAVLIGGLIAAAAATGLVIGIAVRVAAWVIGAP